MQRGDSVINGSVLLPHVAHKRVHGPRATRPAPILRNIARQIANEIVSSSLLT